MFSGPSLIAVYLPFDDVKILFLLFSSLFSCLQKFQAEDHAEDHAENTYETRNRASF